jgi:hypothetical protein
MSHRRSWISLAVIHIWWVILAIMIDGSGISWIVRVVGISAHLALCGVIWYNTYSMSTASVSIITHIVLFALARRYHIDIAWIIGGTSMTALLILISYLRQSRVIALVRLIRWVSVGVVWIPTDIMIASPMAAEYTLPTVQLTRRPYSDNDRISYRTDTDMRMARAWFVTSIDSLPVTIISTANDANIAHATLILSDTTVITLASQSILTIDRIADQREWTLEQWSIARSSGRRDDSLGQVIASWGTSTISSRGSIGSADFVDEDAQQKIAQQLIDVWSASVSDRRVYSIPLTLSHTKASIMDMLNIPTTLDHIRQYGCLTTHRRCDLVSPQWQRYRFTRSSIDDTITDQRGDRWRTAREDMLNDLGL